MFCKNCGKSLNDDAKFCDGCGKSVEQSIDVFNENETPSKPATTQNVTETTQPEKSFWKKKYPEMTKTEQTKVKAIFGVIFGILAVALIVIIIGIFATQGTKDVTETPELYIGETLTNKNGVEFTITDVMNTKAFDNGVGYGITTEDNFILISITIKNGSNKTYTANPLNFDLLKKTNRENDNSVIEIEYDSRTYRFENGMTATDIGPELSKSFVILYETKTSTYVDDYNVRCIKPFSGASDKLPRVIHLKYRPTINKP